MKSGQFQSTRIIARTPSLSMLLYIFSIGELYTFIGAWVNCCFITCAWQSRNFWKQKCLITVIAIVPTLLLFCNSQYGNIDYNTGKQNRKSIYLSISVQLLVVFLTLIQYLFTNAIYWEHRGTNNI